jgi:hypothetical protein
VWVYVEPPSVPAPTKDSAQEGRRIDGEWSAANGHAAGSVSTSTWRATTALAHFSGEFALEHALLWVFDPEGDLTDFPDDIDPAEIAVFAYESILVISAMHEVDGRVRLEVFVDEAPRLDQVPVHHGEGRLEVLSGRLAVAGSPSLDVEDEFRIAGGLYDLTVYGDSDAFSEYVVLHLVRAGP